MAKKEVTEFILDRINPAYLDLYEVLASLDYPIDDYKTFTSKVRTKAQLADKETDNLSELRQELLRLVIGPKDLPIANTRSALEKCHESILNLIYPRTALRNPRDDFEVPDTTGPAIDREFIESVCRGEADEAVKRLGPNASSKQKLLVWLTTYFKCLARYRARDQIINRRDVEPESFIGGR